MKKAWYLITFAVLTLLHIHPARLCATEFISLPPTLLNTHELIITHEEQMDRAILLLRASGGDCYLSVDLESNADSRWVNTTDGEDTNLIKSYYNASINQLITDLCDTLGRINQSSVVLEIHRENSNSIQQDFLASEADHLKEQSNEVARAMGKLDIDLLL